MGFRPGSLDEQGTLQTRMGASLTAILHVYGGVVPWLKAREEIARRS